MRLFKCILMLTVFAVLFAMLPATVAEDEVVIGMEESVDNKLEIDVESGGIEGLDAFDDPSIALEHHSLDLDGLEDKLLIPGEVEYKEVSPASNASGDFEIDENGELIRYRGFAKNVVIPDGVKGIGNRAFENDTIMESVSIPNSVTYIGDDAFYRCTGLKSITIPDSVDEIGYEAFYYCKSLISLQLPNNLTTISSYLFYGCDSLEEISLPASIKKIEANAFSGCDSIKSITLPDGVADIEKGAFEYCDSLESVTIPSSVTIIDREAFTGSDNVVIRGIPDSYAERFAKGVGIPFNAPIVAINQKTTRIYDDDDSYDALILYINQSRILTASQKPADLARALAWASSDTSIVAVDANGTIKGIAQGEATITANTADGKGKAAQIRIVVPGPTEITITDDEENEIVLGKTITISVYKETPYSYETEVDMPITWSSSNSNIISIENTYDKMAILKGSQLGTATITTTTPDDGMASFDFKVVRPEVEKVIINQSSPIKLYPGKKYSLSATLTPAEAEAKLTWYSDDTGIATVDQTGTVTAVKPGETKIYVETYNEGYGYLEDIIDIEVLIPPKGIRLYKTKATLAVGDTLTLKKTLTPEDAETHLTWTSSKPDTVAVSNKGVVTALKPGKAKITVKTDNGKKASAVITVKPAPTKIKLNQTKATLGAKEKLTLKATLSPSDAYTTLSWKSSKPAVAAVSKDGVVTAKKPGTAVITVKAHNGKTARATITVKKAPGKVTLNKSGTVKLAKGKTLKLKATLPKNTASALTWKSSRPKVASVDQKGVVTARARGTAVITVSTFNGKRATVKIAVK